MAERKRALEALDRVDKNKRLKMETLALFLSNSVPSSRVARIAEAAVAAGVTDLQEVADRAKSSKPARNLRCMALKNTRWPRTYKTVLTGHGLASDEPKDCDVEILLPHEIVYTMGLAQEPEELFAAQQEGVMARPDVRRQLRKVLPGQQALALSLRQDGAPFNNNREHSLEMWTMSALCLPDFRFPLVAWPKELQVKFETHDGIFQSPPVELSSALGRQDANPQARRETVGLDRRLASSLQWQGPAQGRTHGAARRLGDAHPDPRWDLIFRSDPIFGTSWANANLSHNAKNKRKVKKRCRVHVKFPKTQKLESQNRKN